MKKRFHSLILLLSTITIYAQTSGSGSAFTLSQAIDFAVQNHVSIKNAEIDEQLAKSKVKEVVGIGLPQVNASFDIKDFLEIPTSLIPAEFFGGPPGTFIGVQFGTQWNATAGVDASQLVFDGTYLVGLQATKTFLELSKKSAERTEVDVRANVSKAYFTVLVNKERLKLLYANKSMLEKLMNDTKAFYENGFAEKIDYDRATVAYNNLTVEIQKIEKFMSLSNMLLKFQMGMDQTTELVLADSLGAHNVDPSVIVGEKVDASKRIEFSLLETQKKLNKLNLKKERFGYLPSVVLYGNVSASAMRNEFNIFESGYRWFPLAVVGGRIGVPIFDGLQRHQRIQQAKLTLMKTENDQLMLAQAISLEATNAQITLRNNTATLEIQKRNLALAEDVFRVARRKYEQGVGSSLEVMNAETSYKEAQTNYFNAVFETLVSQVDYQKATGTLTGK